MKLHKRNITASIPMGGEVQFRKLCANLIKNKN